jgi:hypothetical protein
MLRRAAYTGFTARKRTLAARHRLCLSPVNPRGAASG